MKHKENLTLHHKSLIGPYSAYAFNNYYYTKIIITIITIMIKHFIPSGGVSWGVSLVKSSSKFDTSVSDLTTGLNGGFTCIAEKSIAHKT